MLKGTCDRKTQTSLLDVEMKMRHFGATFLSPIIPTGNHCDVRGGGGGGEGASEDKDKLCMRMQLEEGSLPANPLTRAAAG